MVNHCQAHVLSSTAFVMSLVTSLDLEILRSLNVVARNSWAFDRAVSALADNTLLKGGVEMTLIWWAWFRTRGIRNREHVIATVVGSVVALAVSRLLVAVLPFRVRPLHDSALGFVSPYGVDDSVLAKASSFPSDHAVLFFALATGLFFVSRRAGVLAVLHTLAMIALPRMYLGLHYFSDIGAGGAVGASICWLANRFLPTSRGVQALERLSSAKPTYFYPVMFLVTYQVAELFESTRAIARGLLQVLG
jgi:undecaprenyl-diphosphatase